MTYVDEPLMGTAHLLADSREELHTFAQAMHLPAHRFSSGAYTLTTSDRQLALQLGARKATRMDLLRLHHES